MDGHPDASVTESTGSVFIGVQHGLSADAAVMCHAIAAAHFDDNSQPIPGFRHVHIFSGPNTSLADCDIPVTRVKLGSLSFARGGQRLSHRP